MATFVLTVMHGGVHELGAPGLIQLGDQDLKEFFTVVEVGFFALQAVAFGVLGAGFNAGFAKLLPYRMCSKRLKVAEIAGLVFLCNVIAVMPLFFPSSLGRCFTPPEVRSSLIVQPCRFLLCLACELAVKPAALLTA